MIQFLLDTNVVSEPLKAAPNPNVISNLKRYAEKLAIAAPVWHELVYGVSRLKPSRRRDGLERYLNDVVRQTLPVLPYDETAAQWHGVERARLSGIGKPPAFVDGQIAAIAATNNLRLVTNNIRHFKSFAALKVSNWSS